MAAPNNERAANSRSRGDWAPSPLLTRADGTTQVMSGGLRLCYLQGDTKAGDVTGNGANGFSVATVGGAGPKPSASAAEPAPSSSGESGY